MGSLVIDEANFKSERDVVKEELRQRVLASPYGRLFALYLPQATYTAHPYHRPGIGSIEELDAATIDDVRAFHEAYYRPDNAALIVVGNFDEAQLNAWIAKYLAPLKNPGRAGQAGHRGRAAPHQARRVRRATAPTCRCRRWCSAGWAPRPPTPTRRR